MKSTGTAKSCWKGKRLVIEERDAVKVSKTASVQAEAAFFFFILKLMGLLSVCEAHQRPESL